MNVALAYQVILETLFLIDLPSPKVAIQYTYYLKMRKFIVFGSLKKNFDCNFCGHLGAFDKFNIIVWWYEFSCYETFLPRN